MTKKVTVGGTHSNAYIELPDNIHVIKELVDYKMLELC